MDQQPYEVLVEFWQSGYDYWMGVWWPHGNYAIRKTYAEYLAANQWCYHLWELGAADVGGTWLTKYGLPSHRGGA